MTAIDFQKLYQQMKAEHLNKQKTTNSKSYTPVINRNENKKSNEEIKKKFMNIELNFKEKLPMFNPKIHYLPSSNNCYYISDFISKDFEKRILKLIYSAPNINWNVLKRRRLQCYGGQQTNQLYSHFLKEDLPLWCQQFCDQLSNDCGIFGKHLKPNHMLINEYKVGQGIYAHMDGPKYHQRVVIISLNDILCINFFTKPPSISDLEDIYLQKSQPELQVILEPRSCLIFDGALYTDFFHTIYEKEYDIIVSNVGNLHLIGEQKWKISIGSKIYRTRKRLSMTIRHAFHDSVTASTTSNSLLLSIDKAIEFL